LQLGLAAVDDLRLTFVPPSDGPVGIILLLRSEQQRATWLGKLRQDPGRAGYEVDLDCAEAELAADKQRMTSALLSHLVRVGRIPAEPRAQRTIVADQVGMIAALEQAAAWLEGGICEACWLGGVDSYLDPPMIQALAGLDLLRTPEQPAGLMPGEAACFVVLESAARAAQRKRNVWARIDACKQWSGVERGTDGMLHVVQEASARQPPGLFVVNLNGTEARASEWGNVLVRLTAQGMKTDAPLWIPPLHFGELGSATGPASIALLARGWARDYAPSPNALVCLMEDGTARGAFAVNAV
jgi:3-oxoacyl-[acyl-carrier-protein] synthase I